MGRHQQYADHQRRTVSEPLDLSGHILSASSGDDSVIVGTVRFNVGVDQNFGLYRELYKLDAFTPFFPKHVSITTKLMVAPRYRRSRLAVELACACYRRGLELGTCFDFIDCNPPLVPFFVHLGYRQLFQPVRHPEYGEVVPLVLAMHDVEHLESVASPFSEIGKKFEDWQHSVQFLQELRHNLDLVNDSIPVRQ